MNLQMSECKRMRLLVWGTGAKCQEVYPELVGEIIAFVETNPIQTTFKGKKIISALEVNKIEYDALIIAVGFNITETIEKKILEYNIDQRKVFFIDIAAIKDRARYSGQLDRLNHIFTMPFCIKFEKEQRAFYRYDLNLFDLVHKSWKEDISGVRDYIATKGMIQMFNYPFTDLIPDIQICHDGNKKLFYIMVDGEKMFFPKQWTYQKILICIDEMMKECCTESPLSKESFVKEIGLSADDLAVLITPKNMLEILSLSKKISKITIVDCDEDIRAALLLTFLNKPVQLEFISIKQLKEICLNDNNCCYLNINKAQWNSENWKLLIDFIKRERVCYIASVCYEYPGEAMSMRNQFERLGYNTYYSSGFVYYPYHVRKIKEFALRKAILFGIRKKK